VNYNHEIGNEINIVNGLIANNKTGTGTPVGDPYLRPSGLSAGGVNICMAGAAEVNISSENGVAIFDNSGPKGDIAVWDNSDVSKLKVNEGAMLGGGNHKWEPKTVKGYKANPTEPDKAKARNNAKVIIENNESTFHGAVMSNGIVQFGTKLAELRIRKVDAATQKVMNGVVFKLTSKSNGISRTATTFVEKDGNAAYQGVASFTDLPDGTYTLEEVTPEGYRGTMPWEVTIKDNKVTIKDNGQGLIQPVEGKYYNFVISNQPITVKISKQELGVDTQELPGAKIKVTGPNDFVKEWTSTDKPHEFAVKPGEYTLEEVAAPKGFDAITTVVKFKVDEYGKVTVTNAKEFDDGEVRVKDINHLVLTDSPTPTVTTDAKDAADDDKYVAPTGTAKVIDVVTYKNLKVGKKYTVTGTLHVKNADGTDGGVLKVDGKAVTASKTFTANKANGTVELTFEFDAKALAGKTLVAFESVKRDGKEVAAHTDINDEAQTVRVVKIGTTATDDKTKQHIGLASQAVLNDVVSYEGLKPGEKYTVKGYLVKRADGSLIPGASAEKTFTASATGAGKVTVTFTYDAAKLAGFASVAFEELYDANNKLVAKHADRNDEGQTVYYPEVNTNATDREDADKVLDPEKKVTVVDTVTYTNLIPGKEYTVSGALHVKNADGTDGGVLKVDGKAVSASKTFTPKEKNGSVTLEFTFNASALNGKKLVAFETVKYEGVTVGVHADINDENQTVEISTKPSIGTTATNGKGGKAIEKAPGQKIVDTVNYSNLNTKRTYRVLGEIHVKNVDGTDGGVLIIGGKPVTAQSKDFKPANKDGKVEVTFTVDGSELAGKDLVVFEKLYIVRDGKINADDPMAVHEKIDAKSQTVHVKDNPEIEKYVNKTVHQEIDLNEVFTYDVLAYVTKDADKVVITDTLNDDLQFVSAAGDVKVVDLGESVDHKPYGSVTADGTAVENAVAVINGQTLTVTIEPAAAYRGHWVKMTFDAKIADGKTIADLKFATVEKNDPVITDEQHEGVPNEASYVVYVDNYGTYEDESNEVTVKPTKIGTSAFGKDFEQLETRIRAVFNETKVTVVDAVMYEGLEAGETYTVKGKLVKKSDPSVVVATAEKTFKAYKQIAPIETLEFTFDASQLGGDSVVAFEYLYRGDVTGKDVNEQSEEFVTKHEDVNDKAQTVEVAKPEVETNASDGADGDKHLEVADDVVINDVVAFSGLIPGQEYTLDGTLHVKNDEQTPVDA
ncbi:MAG: VaFE repeat-containing surface-anchored protein, partial [Actinomycetaceae bacterium]|nr:VaFE repeat-containing surface-anchored protein [Actinomycetaceae bacterium]